MAEEEKQEEQNQEQVGENTEKQAQPQEEQKIEEQPAEEQEEEKQEEVQTQEQTAEEPQQEEPAAEVQEEKSEEASQPVEEEQKPEAEPEKEQPVEEPKEEKPEETPEPEPEKKEKKKKKSKKKKEKEPEPEEPKDDGRPKIYAIRTTANREEQVMDFLAANAEKKGLEVFSVIRPHGMRSYIFVETINKMEAEQAAFEVPYARGVLPAPVPYEEIEHMVEQIKKELRDWNSDGYICMEDLNHFRGRYIQSILESEKGELTFLEKEVLESLHQHETLASNINTKFEKGLTVGERLADRIAEWGGSWRFIIFFGSVFLLWIIINKFRSS